MRSEFRRLLFRIRTVGQVLLPPVSPISRYTNADVVRMLAFRLSAHAEIEGFVESCAADLVADYSAKNKAHRLSRNTQRVLLMHADMRTNYPPLALNLRPSQKRPIEKQIDACLNVVSSCIYTNNGVSEKDILKLFIPLGFETSFFDLTWLDSMHELARARGEAAHKSWLGGVSVQPTPQGERSRLVNPLLGLRRLIDEADRLKAQA